MNEITLAEVWHIAFDFFGSFRLVTLIQALNIFMGLGLIFTASGFWKLFGWFTVIMCSLYFRARFVDILF